MRKEKEISPFIKICEKVFEDERESYDRSLAEWHEKIGAEEYDPSRWQYYQTTHGSQITMGNLYAARDNRNGAIFSWVYAFLFEVAKKRNGLPENWRGATYNALHDLYWAARIVAEEKDFLDYDNKNTQTFPCAEDTVHDEYLEKTPDTLKELSEIITKSIEKQTDETAIIAICPTIQRRKRPPKDLNFEEIPQIFSNYLEKTER